MKIRLKNPMVERKWATSPRLALPRNILNSTWEIQRDSQVCLKFMHTWPVLALGASHLVESRCRGRAHSQGHAHKGIPMETVSVGHHDDACDGHYGSNNLREIHCYQRLSIRARFLFICLLFRIISVKLCYTTDPDTHEAILENDPGQEKDKGLVAAVEGRHVGGSQLLQGQEVQVVGQRPQDWEGRRPLYKKFQSHAVLPEEPAALPAQKDKSTGTRSDAGISATIFSLLNPLWGGLVSLPQ